METTTTPEDKPVSQPKERSCDHCGTSYPFITLNKSGEPSSKYCSDKCRWAAAKKRKSGMAYDDEKKQKADAPLMGMSIASLSPQSQYIISHQEKENNKLQRELDNARDENRALVDKNNALREEIAEIKTDYRIKEIEDKKPSGLQGLADNQLVQQLIPHIGPSLGRLMERWLGGSQQLAGLDAAQLDEEATQQISSINAWFASLPKEGQHMVYTILDSMANIQGPQLGETLNRIINLLKNGTTAIPSGNGTYGI